MAEPTTEAALLADAAAGSEPAFRALVEPHRRALEIHCYRMLGSIPDAEEMVNDALLRAWRYAGDFDGRATVRTWLYRIATNACLDELRRRKRQPDTHLQPYPDALADEAAEPIFDPAARYAQREGLELAFLAAIQRLPGRQRAVLILRDVLGWTAPEAAETLQMTTVAVNSALQRARATIDAQHTPEPRPPAAAERELLARYVDAWRRDDVDAVVALMREDAVLRMPPERHVRGATRIGAFFTTTATPNHLPAITLRPTFANRAPALVMERDGEPHGLLVLDVRDGRIAGLDAFRDAATASSLPRYQSVTENPVLG